MAGEINGYDYFLLNKPLCFVNLWLYFYILYFYIYSILQFLPEGVIWRLLNVRTGV